MFFTEMIASGKYIKIKLSLCHNPSLEITVFANSFLSDITNNAKKTNEIIKQIIHITPIIISPPLNESIAKSNGTKRKTIKPSTEPALCIFDEIVTISFVSFTLHQFPSFQKVKVLINRKNQTRIHFLRIYGSSRKRPKIIHAK